MSLPRTPCQTIGPYFGFALANKPLLVDADAEDAIVIEGALLDSAGTPVPDGLVEIWQADADGRYEGGFGWGRCPTDAEGGYVFTTVKPGAVREPDGTVQAPHVSVLCFARGLLKPVLTRLYFADEVQANEADPVLGAIGDSRHRATLIAEVVGPRRYHFDVTLQGDDQTVFFTTPASGL